MARMKRVRITLSEVRSLKQVPAIERLEYDHITPVSRGGSNTARNLELLCEHCNGKKGATI